MKGGSKGKQASEGQRSSSMIRALAAAACAFRRLSPAGTDRPTRPPAQADRTRPPAAANAFGHGPNRVALGVLACCCCSFPPSFTAARLSLLSIRPAFLPPVPLTAPQQAIAPPRTRSAPLERPGLEAGARPGRVECGSKGHAPSALLLLLLSSPTRRRRGLFLNGGSFDRPHRPV